MTSNNETGGESGEEYIRATLERGRTLMEAGDLREALVTANEILARYRGHPPAGVHFLRAQIYEKLKWVSQIHALEAELLVDPANAEARRQLDAINVQMGGGFVSPAERKWHVGIPDEAIKGFEMSSQRYTYRGMPMIKNCFDFALYPMLLHQIRPATIIEVGTLYGASAVWFSDLTGAMGLNTMIYSVDTMPMPLMQADRVKFICGSGRDLGQTFTPEFFERVPRPLLVIEDADHKYPTTLAVLNFFHPVLRSGEYIVVEDGMSSAETREATAEFFKSHSGDYELDANFCDFFGYNVTWCVNGFLRRK